jgi:hypothetical protein
MQKCVEMGLRLTVTRGDAGERDVGTSSCRVVQGQGGGSASCASPCPVPLSIRQESLQHDNATTANKVGGQRCPTRNLPRLVTAAAREWLTAPALRSRLSSAFGLACVKGSHLAAHKKEARPHIPGAASYCVLPIPLAYRYFPFRSTYRRTAHRTR